MRQFILILVLTTFSVSSFAQSRSSWGLKAGLNYNANGDYFNSVVETSENPDRNIGFHVGAFGKIGNKIYFRPELVYSSTKSDYESDEFSMKKIDVPLLVGAKVLGPISVFAGPSIQYILDTDFEDINIDDVENDFSVGLNFGIGANFDSFGLDLRYERGFSENEASFLENNGIGTSRLDTRPDQLILSLSVALN